MRIISGTYKGKRLVAPKKLPVRPTTDFAKEALFNILRHRIDFHSVSLLDLFAGTGNISYEFASRGTEDITAVDMHYGCIKYINSIAEELDFQISTVKADVKKYLSKKHRSFDVVFADPPYELTPEELQKMIEQLFTNDFVAPEGMVIMEHTKHNDLSHISNFKEARRYGGSVFSFFEL